MPYFFGVEEEEITPKRNLQGKEKNRGEKNFNRKINPLLKKFKRKQKLIVSQEKLVKFFSKEKNSKKKGKREKFERKMGKD